MSTISATMYGQIKKEKEKEEKKQHSHFRVNGKNRKYGR